MIREFTNQQDWEAAARAAGFFIWPTPARTQLDREVGETFAELMMDSAYRGLCATEKPPSDMWPRDDVTGLWHPARPEIVPTGALGEDVPDIMEAIPARGVLADSASEFGTHLFGDDG